MTLGVAVIADVAYLLDLHLLHNLGDIANSVAGLLKMSGTAGRFIGDPEPGCFNLLQPLAVLHGVFLGISLGLS